MTSVQERLKLRRQPADVWNTYEQLCLASSVLKSGDQNWSSVSRSLRGLIDKDSQKPPEWYSSKACAQQYSLLLENAEREENPKRKKRERGETTQELIVRQLTQDRIAELHKIMSDQKNEYLNLKSEYKILSTGTISDEKLQKMWMAIEEEERQEQAKKQPPQLLLDIQKAESHQEAMEVTPEEEEKKKGGRSPLLTSLLKSPSPTTQNMIGNQSSAPTIASLLGSSPKALPHSVLSTPSAPIINAPTLSMLLEQPIEHPAPPSVEIKQQEPILSQQKSPDKDETSQILGDIEEIINEELNNSSKSEVVEPPAPEEEPRNIDEAVSLSNSPASEMAIEIDSSTSNIAEIIGTAIQTTTVEENKPPEEEPQVEEQPQVSDQEPTQPEESKNEVTPEEQNFSPSKIDESKTTDDLEAMETLSDKTTVMDDHDIEKPEPTEFPEASTPEMHSVSSDDQPDPPIVNNEPEPKQPADPKPEVQVPKESTSETDTIPEADTEDSSGLSVEEKVEECPKNDEEKIPENADSTLDSTVEMADSSKQKSEIDSDEMNLVNNDDRDEIKPKPKMHHDIDMARVNEIIEDSKLEIKKESEVKDVPKVEIKAENTESLGSNEVSDDDCEPNLLSKSGKAVKTYSKKQSMANDSETESESGMETPEYRAWRKSVLLFFNKFVSSKNASIFTKPITEDQAPGYHAVIHRPMDLSTIKKNIDNGTIRTTAHFQRDVMLMFQNAIMYNKSDSHVYRMTLEMLRECKSDMQILGNVYRESSGENLPLKRETRTATSISTETPDAQVKRKWSHAPHTHGDSDSPRIKKRRRSEND